MELRQDLHRGRDRRRYCQINRIRPDHPAISLQTRRQSINRAPGRYLVQWICFCYCAEVGAGRAAYMSAAVFSELTKTGSWSHLVAQRRQTTVSHGICFKGMHACIDRAVIMTTFASSVISKARDLTGTCIDCPFRDLGSRAAHSIECRRLGRTLK